MKTILTFCLTILLASIISAQVITIDEIVIDPGDQVTVVFIGDDQSVSEGPSGENQTWDFSGVKGQDTIDWRGELVSENELGMKLFPNAELAIRIPTPGNDTIDFEFYEFDNFENDRIVTLGSYAILTNTNSGRKDTTIIDNTSNPREDFQFPIEYGDVFESDFNSIITNKYDTVEFISNRGGTIKMEADATGTITTPIGTFNNVVRVKRVENQSDTFSIEIMGNVFETISNNELVYYDWMQEDRKFSIYRIIKTITSLPGQADQESTTAFYTFGVASSGSNNLADFSKDMEIFPNPVQDQINIEIPNEMNVKQFRIIDVSGQVMQVYSRETKSISMVNFPLGVYFLNIETIHGTYSQKLIKL
ncbi:T9SS type A sorting domain-containing protein [Portibacter lacus]|uniref:Secretion system C-terminal sorting domain-containing protein n=1 Tax=Portibacter lacus TaxID=1099794 RepID=A0AA37SST6_9BACT|nr:T9SS type A sorting domain-containing protein [Portibacter lacus]GLR17553.1 hypothetical protein GCM10007940_21680 [Portibacter lacus]